MKPKDQEKTLSPRDLPVGTLLGFSPASEGEGARLRALQYASLSGLTKRRVAAHGIAGAATALALFGTANVLIIVVWVALLGGALLAIAGYLLLLTLGRRFGWPV